MTTTTVPAAPPPTWADLLAANASLASWERSAASAGKQGLGWWLTWARSTPVLTPTVSHALAPGADTATFHAARAVVLRHLSEIFDREHHLAFPLSRQSRRR